MGFQLSPGVQVKEIDLTNIIPAVATSGGGFVGQFNWGPVDDYTIVENRNRLQALFGKPTDANYVDWFSSVNFLAYSNNLNVIRVVDNATAKNAAASGTGVLIKNSTHYDLVAPTSAASVFVAKYPGALGNSIEVHVADSSTFTDWEYADQFDGIPGTSAYAASLGATTANDELHIIVIDAGGVFTGVPGAILEKFAFVSKASNALGEDSEPNFYGSIVNTQSEYVWWLGNPTSGYGDDAAVQSISITNGGAGYVVAPAVTITDTASGTGASGTSVLAATGAVKSINVTTSGSLYTTAPTVTVSGAGSGAAATAVLLSTGGVASIAVTSGGTGYSVNDPIVITGNGTGATAQVTAVSSGAITSIGVLTPGTGYSTVNVNATGSGGGDATGTATLGYGVSTITVSSGGSGYAAATTSVTLAGNGSGAAATAIIGFAVASVTITAGGSGYAAATTSVAIASPVVGGTQATGTPVISTNLNEWNNKVANGVQYKTLKWSTAPTGAGNKNGKALPLPLSGGLDGSTADDQDIIAGWNLFANAEVVDVSLLFVGDAGGSANSQVIIQHVIDNIADVRKDVVVCFSPDKSDVFNQTPEKATENAITFRNTKINRSSSYAVMDSGWKYQYDLYNDKYRWVPLNADIAGTMANTDDVADPWFSPAGYTRGRIKNVISLALNPSKTNRDELYKNGINPVVSFVGEGVILFGDKTQQTKSSAFSRINVRRLFIVLEKAIAIAAKYQLFEFNDQFTRSSFVAQIEPFLREVKGRRGIFDFAVVCDTTNNTAEVIDRSEFVADIYIKPARSINFITLNFVAVRTGVEFAEVIGQF